MPEVYEEKQIPISIIIPVYNVYEWLDICMESVVNQTFPDFEVLLINDGSTDGSEEKCYEWGKKDSRIKVISKKNEGPSIARNCGIKKAIGEYLVFIDADDWVDLTYLENLYYAVTENKVQMAECDVYRYNNDTGEKTYRVCSGVMGLPYTLEEHMIYGYSAMWKCIVKKSLFTEYGITFPNCHGEAKSVYTLLLALSGKIVNVQKGLYYYRRFRRDSLTEIPRKNNGDEDAIGLQSLDNLLQGFEKRELYDKYKTVLQKSIKLNLSERLAGLLYRREKMDFLQLVEKYYHYIEQKFPNSMNYRYVTLGGYNLNRILWHMNMLHNPYGRFNFSSIISLMHPIKKEFVCSHKNKYREIMVNRDIDSLFWNIMEEIQPEYIFMDFIEERFDIIDYADGFVTKSDAFDGAEMNMGESRVIARDSEECFSLWKISIKKFVEKISLVGCKIVIIENYLSEEVGDAYERKYFADLEFIRKMNLILKQYYDFIRQEYEWIPIIEAFKCKYYYTDKQYEYGAVPSHLNEIVNVEIAGQVEAILV